MEKWYFDGDTIDHLHEPRFTAEVLTEFELEGLTYSLSDGRVLGQFGGDVPGGDEFLKLMAEADQVITGRVPLAEADAHIHKLAGGDTSAEAAADAEFLKKCKARNDAGQCALCDAPLQHLSNSNKSAAGYYLCLDCLIEEDAHDQKD